ncbi:MAG: Gfo/Idh/MocA family oxidoreductase [Chloroflexi bacterium]|nr:Gfo/Idh/MocA family oxidoreductase [Chloroflexota bacterium]
MSRTVRVGVIGSGRMARVRADILTGSGRARLVAVASRKARTGAALAEACGCAYAGSAERLLERDDLDAVLVCTDNASHAELALAALRAGRHVLVEYPLALDARQAQMVMAEAQRLGHVAWVAYDQLWRRPHAVLGAAVRRHGRPDTIRVCVAWPGAPAGSPFRNLRLGSPPALVKPYYLHAILEWLGLPDRHATSVASTGLSSDGHYDTARQRLILARATSSAEARWIVDPAVTGQRVQVELTWAGYALVSDGQRVTSRDGAPYDPSGGSSPSWRQATQRGLIAFLDALDRHADLAHHARLAIATVRLGAAPPLKPSRREQRMRRGNRA